jgi:hypothetical protein
MDSSDGFLRNDVVGLVEVASDLLVELDRRRQVAIVAERVRLVETIVHALNLHLK